MLPLRFVLFGNYKHGVEWGAPTVGGVSLAPGFAGVIEDFQQCFMLFFSRKHGLCVGNE